ncbi:MAG: protein kinase [Pyrinomonadaceae bacterium]
MTPERWEQIDRLLDEVLEIPEAERRRFLDERCAEDEDLRSEVESLLNAHEKADEFIEDSAVRVVAQNLAREKRSRTETDYVGISFDVYRIEKLIGRGGMGRVYLAYDEKLRRQVAVKILPPEYTVEDERVSRFVREARAISALNHPNIVTIYDVDNFENVNYIATEFVSGKILREYVEKGIDLSGTLNILIQCCDALAAAHQAGIIHRDIKPENIIVRPDGYVKILDFGLAKLTDLSAVETEHIVRTAEGLIIGTPSYMSPEQISDDPVDRRTDLWNIGLILYELTTGINPFRKESNRQTFDAILESDPPAPSRLNGEIPATLDRIVNRALQKKPESRYQSAADLRADLMEIKREIDFSLSESGDSMASFRRTDRFPRSLWPLAAGLFVLAAAVGLIWFVFFRDQAPAAGPDWTKAENIQLTGQAGSEIFPDLAPDGKSFVFAAKTGENYDIFLQRVGGKTTLNLTENSPTDDTQPAFSPDGQKIAFRSERDGGGIFVMEETGENPRRVTDFGFHPSWSPDGRQIAVSERGYERPSTRDPSAIWVVDVAGGEKRKLVENYANQPAWSPGGGRIAFWFIGTGGRRDVATISVSGGEPVPVTDSANTNWNPVWSPDGRFLYFASDRNGNMAFWRVRINESTGEVSGEPEIVPTPAKFNSHLAFSDDGRHLIYVQTENQSNIKAVDFDEKAEKIVDQPFWITRGDYEIIRPRLSPDGGRFVADLARQTQEDIVLIDRDGSNWRDLTKDEYFDRYPRWSPDGKKIAFTSDRTGVYKIWTMNADGTDLRQMNFDEKSTSFPIWSPDGRRLTFHIGQETFILDLTKDLKEQTPERLPLFDGLKYLVWDWSPDGKKLAGNWGDYDGNAGIGYLSLETGEYVKVSSDKSEFPFWLSDSRRLIWVYDGNIRIADIDSKTPRQLLALPQETITSLGISRDGRLLYFTVFSSESNIWMMDLDQP